MPRRTTKTSQAAGAGVDVLSGDEDAVAPPPRRVPREVVDRLRGMQLTFNKKMYDYAVCALLWCVFCS